MHFDQELALFRERTEAPAFDALILLGTGQPTTAALLIGALNPRHVAFLLTEATRDMPANVAQMLGCSDEDWLRPEGDYIDPLQVYMGLKEVLERWRHDPAIRRIAVDVTAGLKPMSVALAKAAHVLDLTIIYIESDYEPNGQGSRSVVSGSQRLVLPPDPYQVFGDLEADRARKLYHAHDYAGAQRIFALLGERVPGAGGQRYTALEKLAALYAAWDVLDFAGARRAADDLLAMPLASIPELAPAAALLERQRDDLQKLMRVSQLVKGTNKAKLQLLADSAWLLPLLGTLHASALRRAADGRYDFAALFRYRCLELISQHRIATHKILCSNPDFKVFDERKDMILQKIGRNPDLPHANRAISLFSGYKLLAALEDPLVQGYDILQIEERTKARNTSVLAHGYRLIDKSEYDTFASVVDEVIDRFFTLVLHEPREVWEQNSSFYQLEV